MSAVRLRLQELQLCAMLYAALTLILRSVAPHLTTVRFVRNPV